MDPSVRCGCKHAVVHFDSVIVELNQLQTRVGQKKEVDDFSFSFAVIVTPVGFGAVPLR